MRVSVYANLIYMRASTFAIASITYTFFLNILAKVSTLKITVLFFCKNKFVIASW